MDEKEPLTIEQHHRRVVEGFPEFERLLDGEKGSSTTAVARESNFGVSLDRWVSSGFARVAREIRSARLASCVNCEELRVGWPIGEQRRIGDGVSFGVRTCNACGCAVSLKSWIATEVCPIGKW